MYYALNNTNDTTEIVHAHDLTNYKINNNNFLK